MGDYNKHSDGKPKYDNDLFVKVAHKELLNNCNFEKK